MYDILIIGAGASGMAAALMAARINPSAKICILEKKEKPGKKISASGNGRCNITNTACKSSGYVREFLSSAGILTREEDEGRVYPYSGQASQVVDALVHQLSHLNVELICKTTVGQITENRGGGFVIKAAQKKYETKKLLIACGGKSSPVFGTSGDGYIFAKNLGHSVKRLAPVLTSLNSDNKEEAMALKGIRVKARLSLYKNEIKLAEELGEVQFTETGISGIAVFNLSRFVRLEEDESPGVAFGQFYVIINFMPDYELNMIEKLLIERSKLPGMNTERILNTIFPDKLAEALSAVCMMEQNRSATPTESDIKNITTAISSFRIKLSGAGGWKDAQCTAGGVSLDEVEADTMESKIVKGLYFSGEILDYDGPCGGYNLQNAWETGIKAGTAMAGRGN
ncbi:MAG: aminoacetone oxidase family FAD-binding enzyme [Eubacteriales bacterium]|nr:aminoacetone oxidase family FAD-binding enzyme [Eubacteriales bacterium]MDD4390349.1 aminoacetone oxidase family FAD-binding enzyme [Eubacteriales bacterium]